MGPKSSDRCPYKKRQFGHRPMQKEDMKTQGEDAHLQAAERSRDQSLPSQLSRGTSLADTLISGS